MSIIQTHDVTLYGGNNEDIILRPLCDKHLPQLYKWCADPDVLCWTEGGAEETNLSYDSVIVNQIYGGVSKNAYCFLIEVDGVAIGECRLQKMNLPKVRAMYGDAVDVRGINLAIGEKAYWGKGIGTQLVDMLIDFAFCGENVDVLHCCCKDYNVRSNRLWEKRGFTRILKEPLTQPQIGIWRFHYRLTCQEYIKRHTHIVSSEKVLTMPINKLQPSQLYISKGKIGLMRRWFDPNDMRKMDAIPIKELDSRLVMTDGHTRAVLAYLSGWEHVPVYLEDEKLNWEAYRLNVKWCDEVGINTPMDLAKRIVPYKDYERLWRKRCMKMSL